MFPQQLLFRRRCSGWIYTKLLGWITTLKRQKRHLSDAGFSDVSKFPKVEIVFYEKSADLVKAYQEMWKSALGVEVILVPVKSGEELYKYIDDKKPGLFILGTWIADYIDPQNFTDDTFFLPDTHYPNPVRL